MLTISFAGFGKTSALLLIEFTKASGLAEQEIIIFTDLDPENPQLFTALAARVPPFVPQRMLIVFPVEEPWATAPAGKVHA